MIAGPTCFEDERRKAADLTNGSWLGWRDEPGRAQRIFAYQVPGHVEGRSGTRGEQFRG